MFNNKVCSCTNYAGFKWGTGELQTTWPCERGLRFIKAVSSNVIGVNTLAEVLKSLGMQWETSGFSPQTMTSPVFVCHGVIALVSRRPWELMSWFRWLVVATLFKGTKNLWKGMRTHRSSGGRLTSHPRQYLPQTESPQIAFGFWDY